ncbi:DUF3054 domain-containing protein [Marisediminicola antarctica]|uniref:DUF3054 domain-containing protein n=1 Tax=Marisediminicola antarctica TaxID=674079 RepID=A0A7L5AN81_9MICO|nr:DUF3054 domain-containing protein [Marisediminicola antarctica]QHO70601.1 hypothetical protein BHD05_14025 [Marisediminicola antarctica]
MTSSSRATVVPSTISHSRRVVLAVAIDVALVVAFVLIGRSSHSEGITPAGVLGTAWPFLVGLAAGWALARAWRRPFAVAPGLTVWATTVIVGLLLRATAGDGVQSGFVAVTALVLAAFLLGWRGAVSLRSSRLRR